MRAAQGVAIVLVTSMVLEEGEEVVSTLSPEGGEWMTMTQTLLELVDLIALSMVDDKKKKKTNFHLLYVHVHIIMMLFLYMYHCIALGILCMYTLI